LAAKNKRPLLQGREVCHAFITDSQQGIMLSPGIRHHVMLAMENGDFAVIERVASTMDCELTPIHAKNYISVDSTATE
jgi:ureidoglycolate hydrolase